MLAASYVRTTLAFGSLLGTLVLGGCGSDASGAAPVDALSESHDAPLGDAADDGSDNVSANGVTPCRTSADCPARASSMMWVCLLPYGYYRCGPVLPSRDGVPCTDNSQCNPLQVCRASAGSDGSVDSSGLLCVPGVGCTDDSQCGGGEVCRADPTVSPGLPGPTGLVCSPPCSSDLDCVPTDKCESAGYCQARTCAECPSYFSCASGACTVPSCSTDADCPGGYCVGGRCAGYLGVCRWVCE